MECGDVTSVSKLSQKEGRGDIERGASNPARRRICGIDSRVGLDVRGLREPLHPPKPLARALGLIGRALGAEGGSLHVDHEWIGRWEEVQQ